MSLEGEINKFENLIEFFDNFIDKDISLVKNYVDSRSPLYLYTGDDTNDNIKGVGKLYSISKDTDYKIRLEYEGDFCNNCPYGDGNLYYYSDKSNIIPRECYQGEVVGCLPHGLGTIYFYNVRVKNWSTHFVGTFEHGEKDKEGREFYLGTNKTKFIGSYYNGLKSGFGLEFDLNGEKVYEGSYSGDLKHGYGIGYSTNLEIRCVWKYGRIDGEASGFLQNFINYNLKKTCLNTRSEKGYQHETRNSTFILEKGCRLLEVRNFLAEHAANIIKAF